MRILSGREAAAMPWNAWRARGSDFCDVEPRVRRIVNDVRRGGDRALRRYAQQVGRPAAERSRSEFRQTKSKRRGNRSLRRCARRCARPRRTFANSANGRSPQHGRRSRDGISLGQLVRPLESVGCYVPGGRYPLVSTLLMTVIPAQVAGVPKHPRGLAQTLAGSPGCGRDARRPRILSRWRSAGDRGAGLRHREHPTRRQDCRPGKCVRDGRQEAGLVRLRD